MKLLKSRRILFCALLFLMAAFLVHLKNTDRLRYENRKIGQMHFEEITNAANKKKPLVILQHGLGGTKEDFQSWAEELARQGYIAVLLDADGHGEYKKDISMDLTDVILNTSKWYDEIIEYYQERGRMEQNNFALIGMSLGGMIAMHYGAYGRYTPQCVIGLYTSFDWKKLEGAKEIYTIIRSGELCITYDETERKVIRNKLEENSPLSRAGNLLKTHMLMINGDQDAVMPLPDADRLKDAAENIADAIQNEPKIVIRKQQGHDIADGDSETVREFLSRYLPI